MVSADPLLPITDVTVAFYNRHGREIYGVTVNPVKVRYVNEPGGENEPVLGRMPELSLAAIHGNMSIRW